MKKSPYIFTAIVCILSTCPAQPQDTLSSGSEIIPWRLGIVAGGTAGLIVTAHLQNYNSWWKGERGPLHLSVDDPPSLGADKCGHFLFSYYASDLVGRSLGWSGVESDNALLYGALVPLAFQLYVEVEDGFHPELGFSIVDAVADGIGAFFPLLQENYSFFKAISPKWSFNASERYQQGLYRSIIDDYESQTYWLSLNMRQLFGESTPRFIPSFLNVAVGYGVTNLDMQGNGDRELYIGLDIDFNKLPGEGDVLVALKHLLNFVHLPAPTIRLTPGVVIYGLRF